ncbi:MAG: hypothetical protein NTV34_18460 [Proteobacteria bacterium]|nr:hypothetical protein [Pseudomonadota bacterium]
MRAKVYRAEPGRFELTGDCKGTGRELETGVSLEFRGVDVSKRGFGCVLTGNIKLGDSIILQFPARDIQFKIMWLESHLGIEGKHRAGLTPIDFLVNLESLMEELGLLHGKAS